MRVLGIDPGYAIIGYGAVDYDGVKFKTAGYGAVTTKAGIPFEKRLEIIFEDMKTVISNLKPDCMSIEKLYFNTNTTTAIDVAQARGCIILAAQLSGIEIYEYTPLQVKQSVTGYGKAEKRQVMEMTKNLLSLSAVPKPDDTADALALALCHAHSYFSRYQKLNREIRK